jgi:hypothetical protein
MPAVLALSPQPEEKPMLGQNAMRSISATVIVTAALVLLGGQRLLPAADCNRNGVEDAIDLTPTRLGLELIERHDTGLTPRSLAAGDFDGDGDLDLASADRHADQITVLVNDGSGGFMPAEPIAVANPGYVAAADFDGDGRSDLAVSSSLAGHVSVFFSLGSRFGPARRFAVGASSAPDFITHGDLDGDGRADLALVRRFAGDIAVLRNLGGGEFAPAEYFSLGRRWDVRGLVLADFDGDSDLDVAVPAAAEVIDGLVAGGAVIFLANDGSGTFGPPLLRFPTFNPVALAPADLDGDGDVDLAVISGRFTSPVTTDNPASLLLYVNLAPFDFAVLRSLTSAFSLSVLDLTGVTASDLDRDGDADLAVLTDRSDVVLLANNGAGTFRLEPRSGGTLRSVPRALVAAPFDLEEDYEVATVRWASDDTENEVAVFDVVFRPASFDCDGDGTPDDCQGPAFSADCNGDGVPDRCQPGGVPDCDGDAVPDCFESDCDANGIPDDCDPTFTEVDTNLNGGDDRCEPVLFTFRFEGPSELRTPSGGVAVSAEFGCVIETELHRELQPFERGAQGWTFGAAAEGMSIVGATTRGTVAGERSEGPPGIFASGFQLTELTHGPGNEGVVSAVVLAIREPITLPVEEPSVVLRIEVAATTPTAGGVEPARLYYRDGLRGTGQPVMNRVTQAGETYNPVLAEKTVLLASGRGGDGFVRGDSNDDGRVDISDAIHVLGFLFLGSRAPPCLDAADTDDSGILDLTDGVAINLFLFLGAAAPPPPGTVLCGPDPSADALRCDASRCR